MKMNVVHINLTLDYVLFTDYFYEQRKIKMLMLLDLL